MKRRILSGLLSLTVTASIGTAWLPGAASAAPIETKSLVGTTAASISMSICFDLPQTREEIGSRNVTLKLTGGSVNAELSLSDGSISGSGLKKEQVSIQEKSVTGVPITTEQRLGRYDLSVSGLAAGSYTLTLSGDGYISKEIPVQLSTYSQHITVSTLDGSFAIGDLDGNNLVNRDDLDTISRYLGDSSTGALQIYDLNGDNVIDVTDLAYVNNLAGVSGQPRVLDTSLIAIYKVEDEKIKANQGKVADLFQPNSTVQLAPKTAGQDLSIPMVLTEDGKGVVLSEIAITTPVGTGAVENGTVKVELADGTVQDIPFAKAAPAGLLPITRDGVNDVITINLGNKVPVKKVTITVTQVTGQSGKPEYANLTQIEFLKDIVPENPQDATQVKGLVATAGEGSVQLVWNPVNNITGYVVKYGTSRDDLNQQTEVSATRTTIPSLKGDTTYYFQVIAVNRAGSELWQGTPSEIVSATTRADKVPAPPESIKVMPANNALRLSWKSMEGAAYYQVFYRPQGQGEFKQYGGNISATSTAITDLVNGTTYELMLKAGNAKGLSGPSQIVLGIPNREDFKMPELPSTGRIPNTSITSITLTDPKNVDSNLCPSFQTGHLIDNDPSTYWVAQTWSRNSDITYTLDKPYDMNYLLVVPYLAATHKNVINTYTVTLKDEQGNVLSTGQYRAPTLTEQEYLIFSFPETKNVKSVTLGMGEKEGWGARVSISEIAFYESDTLADEIAALFGDKAFTTVAPGVTTEQIGGLRQRLEALKDFYLDRQRLSDELDLAEKLLAGDHSTLGPIRSNFQSRSNSADGKNYGQTASEFQPLGITGKAGSAVSIYAELPTDAPVYVVPTQYYGESDTWKGAAVALNPGRNYITTEKIGTLADPRGGAFYLTYTGNNPEQIKLQIRGYKDTAFTPVLELSNWYTLDESGRKSVIRTYVQELERYVASLGNAEWKLDTRNVTDVSTPSVLLSLPADQILAGLKGVGNSEDQMVDVMYQNIQAWEEVIFVANKVQGIVANNVAFDNSYRNPMTTRQNIRYSRMFAGAFMFAAGSSIGVEYGSAAPLVQGRPTSVTGEGKENALFGWGIAHEIGHNMDKLGKAEITNNIYSMALQAWDGSQMIQDTRLTKSNVWEDVYEKVSVGRPGSANNVFVQLGMYWQLHLAYDQGANPLDFYNRFFTMWKSGEYSGADYNNRVALIASKVANHNLTEFFTRWGMELSQETKNTLSSYTAEDRAIWYLNDASYRSRLQNESTNPGTVTVNASVVENKVTLTLTGSGATNLLGYEIRRNGVPIGFTKETTFVDDLGAANNLAYEYSAVPVDVQGKLGTEGKANQIRVAYDKTIPTSQYSVVYDLESDTQGWKFTFTNGSVPVTGLKVQNATPAGTYKVEVLIDDPNGGQRWVTAKQEDFAEGSFVSYFNKPGVDARDTRIWTYDALEIRVVGIPQTATISLLDYPGDRVDFYEGATVGTLKDGYGNIPAGTLVVLGTYRGDPVYNYATIQGRYNTTHYETEGDIQTIERNMAGEVYLFAEIPADGAVSDTSDGFFLFVPDLEAEKKLNEQAGVTEELPLEIQATFYRSNTPGSTEGARVTSQTLWISFPDEEDMPQIVLNGNGLAN